MVSTQTHEFHKGILLYRKFKKYILIITNASDSTHGEENQSWYLSQNRIVYGQKPNQTKMLSFKYSRKYLVTLFPLPLIFLALCLFSHDWYLHTTVMLLSDIASSVLTTLFWLYFQLTLQSIVAGLLHHYIFGRLARSVLVYCLPLQLSTVFCFVLVWFVLLWWCSFRQTSCLLFTCEKFLLSQGTFSMAHIISIVI